MLLQQQQLHFMWSISRLLEDVGEFSSGDGPPDLETCRCFRRRHSCGAGGSPTKQFQGEHECLVDLI